MHNDVLAFRISDPSRVDLPKTGRLVVVDQSWPFASVASEVVTQVIETAFDWLDHQPIRVNTEDVPTPYAKNLETAYLPNPDRIATAIRSALG